MPRIKTNRTQKITLMLAPETIEYLEQTGEDRGVGSISSVADRLINEHRSFFSATVETSKQSTKVEPATADATA